MAESDVVDKALQRVRDAKAAIVGTEAEAKAAREAADAAARKHDNAMRERLTAENDLLTLVNNEPRLLMESD